MQNKQITEPLPVVKIDIGFIIENGTGTAYC